MTEHTKSPSLVPYTGELIHTLNEIVGVTLAGLQSTAIRTEEKSDISKAFRPFSSDFCWQCGNRGYWMEQIDGPDNLRRVECPNPIHLDARAAEDRHV